MRMLIVDPITNQPVRVDENGALLTDSLLYTRENLIITATPAALAANDTVFWLRNNEQNKILVIDSIRLALLTADSQVIIHSPVGTTPAGTALSVQQKDLGVTPQYDIDAYYDETANTQGTVYDVRFMATGAERALVDRNEPFRIPHGKEWAFDVVTAQAAGANVSVECHLEEA